MKLENSVRNHIDMLISYAAICDGASRISPDGRTEITCANFCSPGRKKTLRNGELHEIKRGIYCRNL